MEIIKKYILSLKCVNDHLQYYISLDRDELYRKAFKDAQADLKETHIEDTDKKAVELAEKKLSEMLSVVDMNKVISSNKNGFIYLGTERASDIQLQNLKAEAEFLKNSSIWGIIHETPKELAQRAMFVAGDSLDDMKKGRSILYTLDSQKKVIDMLLLYNKK